MQRPRPYAGSYGAGATWAALCRGGESISILRLFHYFAATHRPELGVTHDTGAASPRIGSSPHTDWHLLTVILQDRQGGLQVLSPAGRWLDVPAYDGELVRDVGYGWRPWPSPSTLPPLRPSPHPDPTLRSGIGLGSDLGLGLELGLGSALARLQVEVGHSK